MLGDVTRPRPATARQRGMTSVLQRSMLRAAPMSSTGQQQAEAGRARHGASGPGRCCSSVIVNRSLAIRISE
jgi:hypothetical protein